MISDEQRSEILAGIRGVIPRSLLVDVQQQFPVAASQAEAAVTASKEAVSAGVTLSRKRASKATGLVRFQMIDEMFENSIVRAGGEFVNSIEIEKKPGETRKAPVFLTTGRFGGTMVGFASHREKDDLPVKNASRIVLCSQNRGLMQDMFQPLEKFTERERFVLIMVRRDRHSIGKLEEMTVCVVSSDLKQFLIQESLTEFLAGYGTDTSATKKSSIQLKPVKRAFKATHVDEADEKAKGVKG